jgi:UDP:flavonoid glycosyltransferase YjiC (YdhE family)
VLRDPSYSRNAEQIRDQIAELPGPEHAATLLVDLATEKQPIHTT